MAYAAWNLSPLWERARHEYESQMTCIRGKKTGLRKASQKKLDIASGKLGRLLGKDTSICKGLGDTAMGCHHKKFKVYTL